MHGWRSPGGFAGGLVLVVAVCAHPARGDDRYSLVYPCFEKLQQLHAGSAAGGRFGVLGDLYLLPAVRSGRHGLYVLGETVSTFQPLEVVPASKKDDYLLHVEIISHLEYVFVIRFEGPASPHAEPGWSIAHYTQDMKRPRWERRLAILPMGRDSSAVDAMREEMRRSLPHLADRFLEQEKNADLYPTVRRFAEEFRPALDLSMRCARQVATGDADLEARFAVAHVELLRALDRFDRDVARGDDEGAWRSDLQDLLCEEICRRLRCNETQRQDVRREAARLADATVELHRLMASVRTTYGPKWQRPLLSNLLEAAGMDSLSAQDVLERR